MSKHVVSQLRSMNAYQIGNVFVLDRWYCDFELLSKQGHSRLMKYNNCPERCLDTATDHDTILSLLEIFSDLDPSKFNSAVKCGYMDIILRYESILSGYDLALELDAESGPSYEIYNYVFHDRSKLTSAHLHRACHRGNSEIVKDIIKHLSINDANYYLYATGDRDLIEYASTRKSCYVSNLIGCIVCMQWR